MINYLLIDNNLSTFKRLQNVLNVYTNFIRLEVSILKTEIIDCIQDKNVSLVFINIDEVSEDILTVISEIQLRTINPPLFIAVSGKKESAYEAIKAGFGDFILLPLNKLDFEKAITNFKKLNTNLNKSAICIKSYKDFQYLELDSIVYLKADNNTTDFFLNNGAEIIAYKTLKVFQEAMPSNFIRIHRSYIININYVSRIQYGKNSCTVKYLNKELPFSKAYLNNIKNIVQFLNYQSVYL